MSDQPAEKKSYKETINKPQTPFPMKANLVQNEPASRKRWAGMGLYKKVRAARAGKTPYVFHDGPPYANGNIHLGHLLNKVLKDIVVRSRTMMDLDCPYVPGWDCHGLPIEHKVVEDLGPKAREMEPFQIRRKCQAYAEKWVKTQSDSMQRLLTLADYDDPYLTMDPRYERASLEVFADIVERDLVYRALKPVHWSIANHTALADAELEYQDREDTSVYVLFEVTTRGTLEGKLAGQSGALHLMIWTTTPWTLPANLAVAAAPRAEYGIYRVQKNGESVMAIIASDLADKVLSMGNPGAGAATPVATCTGADLATLRYRHPFIDRTSPVVHAEYVTLEDGTGLVHTAPGHGVEDYQTGLKECIHFTLDRKEVRTGKTSAEARPDTYCPVKEDGTYDDTVPEWLRAEGVDVWKANDLVVDVLKKSGHLFHSLKFMHSYPHDWRSKTPIIFRATEQWFVSVDKVIGETAKPGTYAGSIRTRSLEAANHVKFYPDWGRNRLRGMLESRPDWCISRQRAWGLPIPAFFHQGRSDQVLLTAASVRAVAANFGTQGSDLWFKATPAELLAGYDVKKDPHAPAWLQALVEKQEFGAIEFKKSTDIFDVWFDSGTSWAAVIRQRFGDAALPADLYLEGSDQHRGWFQASLLPAVATTGLPPFKAVLTHGFMVDKDGKKISKSDVEQQKHIPSLDELFKDFGTDIARWWISSLNTDNDIKIDREYFKLAGEEYRKVRNTIKYLLSNLYDFEPGKYGLGGGGLAKPQAGAGAGVGLVAGGHGGADCSDFDPLSIDAWVLGELNKLIEKVDVGYREFGFRAMHEAIFDFCNETLSAVYLAATKDRMYCDRADSPRRVRSQRAMYVIVDALVRMIAPIMTHTADEAWRLMHSKDADACVHLEVFAPAVRVSVDPDWARVMALRDVTFQQMETARKNTSIDNPLDLGLNLKVDAAHEFVRRFDDVDLADLFGVSKVSVVAGASGYGVEVLDLREQPRCERSWKRDGTVKKRKSIREDLGFLSDRDAKVMDALPDIYYDKDLE